MANTTTITLGEKEYALRASNWASQLYADEFFGKVSDSYNGNLQHDAAQVFADCVTTDEDGENLTINFVPPTLWRVVWALAYAGGSVQLEYDKGMDSVRDEMWTVGQQAEACGEVLDLMMRTFFR